MSSTNRAITDGTVPSKIFPSPASHRSASCIDGSGFYRSGVTQYNIVGGPRYSANIGKLRPFIHAMAGIRHLNSGGFVYNPLVIDVGGGVDYKLFFKNFSWRFQGDYMHTHYSQRHSERLPRLHRNRLAVLS